MKKISVFDTSVCSSNLGDQIIIDSIRKHLRDMFPKDFFVNIQTHDVIGKSSYKLLKDSDYKFVAGTNLLSSNMNTYNQWKISLKDCFFLKDVILMGVGWWQYQNSPNAYTKFLLHRVLSQSKLHSVRDKYTEGKLRSIGFKNAINTACPTMWGLTEEHCSEIPCSKSESVLVTFTEYNRNKDFDSKLIQLLQKKYENILFWTQQPKDYWHMKTICGDDKSVIYIEPSLQALNQVLECNTSLDYIGTRLHAGIRALQYKRRTLILAVDNRAMEISKDTNLPVLPRDDFDGITRYIESSNSTKVNLPWENIRMWKDSFISLQK